MKRIIIQIICCLFLQFGYSQNQNPELTKTLQSIYKKSGFPGFAVAVLNENGIVYENAFGFADVKNKLPYTTNSVQNIGSVSKTFIGVALLKAVELGYFNLDADVNSVLPFNVSNPDFPNAPITIRQLATHTSSIIDDENVYPKTFYPNEYSDVKSVLYKDFITHSTIQNQTDLELSTFLKSYLSQGGKLFNKTNFATEKPGTAYHYSNIASALAAYIIEVKAKIPFDQFCKKYIFEPLQMNQTSWKLTDSIVKNHVKIYNRKMQYYPLYSEITYPDGSLKTSISDLSKYLAEMISGLSGNGKILSKESFTTLFQKQFSDDQLPIHFDPKEPNSGIFWRIKSNGQIGHTGSDLGITTFMFFDPKTKTGKIFLTNIEFDDPHQEGVDKKLVNDFLKVWKTLDN
ncbi:serine hydrolase [Flavobacterium noncentrifugens]|uniref:CubicO group peptidase, beta-lactamase class C family n=1 Tax=Flavobacterium noncentrifugens TaxID=1128970 RepID=A0A1G9CMG3_9FLAO|nr:serine hydrolase domain-containing protein [Flavobacterium noncentrifugens]GEP52090.1 serine hydrolase [Flavobacterium noncentrifugens]SDK52857.1 CubicO group peptidase, beta-lactamase class C family [Flavobacterium noncentrifugens]